jgi:hypothetical protein
MPELLTRSDNTAHRLAPSSDESWAQRINEFANPDQQSIIHSVRKYGALRSYEKSKTVFDTNVFISHAEPLVPAIESPSLQVLQQISDKYRNLILYSQVRALLSEGKISKAIKVLLEATTSGYALSEPLQRLHNTLYKRSAVRKPITAAPRTKEATWIKNNWDAYKGKWVAILDDQAVASGCTLKEVLADVKNKQLSRSPIVHRIQ